ncbi:MAG TPA: DNA primase [Candidatus Methylacidiphilales bacterium]|jgi:DNA primase|nr:DNA primase [Candidatus Methylacidiphilales bacterium]
MAGMIPPEIVEQVRHASDIVDVIGGYVPLKKSGAKFKALSPFNKEKTPSFFVDPSKQIFKCFSSGHGGDVFKFLMLMENMTFPEAVRRLAQRMGVVIPESGPHDPEARGRREELLALYAGVAAWWQKLLKTDPAAEPARAYLKSRDFPGSLAEEFGLGYAPEGWDATMKWAQKNGYGMEALETGKLVATSAESGRKYDFFRGRLMIPIHNDAGEVVAFSGRLLDPEAKAQKYVNSPETPIFVKSRILFGLNKTKRNIIEAESAVLCEGQIDLMRCWQHGIRNVVAPQGTAFTDPHARILKRLAKEVVICFDADSAGRNAAQRTIDVLLKEDLQVRIARIPQGEDPDSLLRKQPVAVFEAILREAKDYTRHLLDTACEEEEIASPRGRGAVAAKMAQVIAKIPNAVQRETFLLEVARRLQVPRSALEEEVRKAEAQIRRSELQQRNYPAATGAGEGESESHAAQAEAREPIRAAPIIEALLSLLLTNPGLVAEVSRRLDSAWVAGLGGAEALLRLLDAHAHDAFESATQFMEECDDPTRDYLAGLLFHPTPVPTETTAEAYAGNLVRNIEKRWKQQRLQMLNLAVKSDELSVEERMKYLMEIQAIRRQFPDLEP